MTNSAIEFKSVWKIYGPDPLRVLNSLKESTIERGAVLQKTGHVLAIADVSFSVEEGEIFCVMGLSGSGKSTLIRHINRLVEPSAGVITVGSQDVGALNARELRRLRSERIAMVFQNVALLPHRNVRDNVAIALELRGASKAKRAEAADHQLALVQLDGWGDRMPAELSGGMKQRVGLARALAADPEILLMDEPYSALDPIIRRQLQKQFLDLAKVLRKTTVFITHDLEEAIRLGNRIAIMKDGHIVQIGTPEDIVLRPANEYVAQFVGGISRLDLVTARSIMSPLSEIERKRVIAPVASLLSPSSTLRQLASATLDFEGNIVIAEQGEIVGAVTQSQLLRAIIGDTQIVEPGERMTEVAVTKASRG